MERPAKTIHDVAQLLQISDLVSTSIRRVIEAWSAESNPSSSQTSKVLPSPALFSAQRTLLAATGTLAELVSEPSVRVLELGCQYWESRALYIAAERRIPDALAEAEGASLTAEDLAGRTGIEARKLDRIMRCLCSNHVFREVEGGKFANNRISAALVGNEPLRAYVLLFPKGLAKGRDDNAKNGLNSNLDLYTAADHLPRTLLSPTKGSSYKVEETAFQDAVGTNKPRWEWLEEKVNHKQLSSEGVGYPGLPSLNGKNGYTNGDMVSRPELEVFGLAMLGGGKVFGAAHPYDYPWNELGEATVVDVGGGVGGFDIQLSHLYPKLSFVVQDRGPVLQQAKHKVWPKENAAALAAGRVKFMEHDFFQNNPVHGADVYWLRYILHDWSDEYCIDILSAIFPAMSKKSRILICDQVMNTTLGCPELSPAPSPLPANYGVYTRYSHQRDLAMMGIINGIERTPEQFRKLVGAAGLRVHKIWECRSQVGIVELRTL